MMRVEFVVCRKRMWRKRERARSGTRAARISGKLSRARDERVHDGDHVFVDTNQHTAYKHKHIISFCFINAQRLLACVGMLAILYI